MAATPLWEESSLGASQSVPGICSLTLERMPRSDVCSALHISIPDKYPISVYFMPEMNKICKCCNPRSPLSGSIIRRDVLGGTETLAPHPSLFYQIYAVRSILLVCADNIFIILVLCICMDEIQDSPKSLYSPVKSFSSLYIELIYIKQVVNDCITDPVL